MKRIAVFLLSICLILCSAGCGGGKGTTPVFNPPRSYRDIPGVREDEIEAIEALKSARDHFAYGACLATEAFAQPDGSLAGFTQSFCELLSGLFGINFELTLYNWDELLDLIEEGAVDFTGDLTATGERMRTLKMTSPIAERMLRIFYTTASEFKTETDINGLRIGFLTDSVTADSIIEKYRCSFISVDVDNYQEAARMLKDGVIDAFVDEAVADPAFLKYAYYIRSQVFFPMVHAPVSLATANPELAPIIDVVSKYIDAGGLDELYALYKEGEFEYAKYKLDKSLTAGEKAFIEDLQARDQAVAVAYEYDNYPINFYNEKEGEYEGIAVDVLAQIGRLTGLRFEQAVAADTSWAEIYDLLKAGEIHMVAQLLQTGERSENFIWSGVPYASSYYALLSKSDYPALETYQVPRVAVGVNRSSGKVDIFNELFPNHRDLVMFETQNECLDALERGDVDLLMASEYNLLMQQNYREKSGFMVNIKLDAALDSYFGFRKDEGVLCSIIDKAQQYVRTDAIEINWTGRSFDYSKRLAEERTRYLTIFVGLMFFVLAGIVFVLIKNVRLSKKLEEMANYDSLTEIFNRRYFFELATIQIARSIRLSNGCFIAIYDLDRFKSVNDTFGHLAGDKVLKEIAQRVKKTIRPYDLLGRYGGEEFVLLMCDTDRENVISAVERIRLEICGEPVEFEGTTIPISASFGIAAAADAGDIAKATQNADEALYQAKESGRNRIVFYDEGN